MSTTTPSFDAMGWNLEHSYQTLPAHAYAKIPPAKVKDPHLVIKNTALAQELGIDFNDLPDATLADLFSGNHLPDDADPIAQAYAGHQFGNFTMLGDGRAHLMGEHVKPDGQRYDIQFKGSGRTPFSRRGDGRAALGPMLREYIISEAMHALNIPTTRSLAVTTTGEPVFRETVLTGAILTRVATSHLRVGTFQYFAATQDKDDLKKLADYAIARHDPQLNETEDRYKEFLQSVMHRQIALITNWLRVGFIHGVMNTDNMTISGETIDYGPCAFMDAYDPNTVFSSIDRMRRYAFENQIHIAQWNLARLAETLLPLLHEDSKQAVKAAEDVILSFDQHFKPAYLNMMRQKLGLFGAQDGDQALVDDLLTWMQRHHMDYTNTFRDLSDGIAPTDKAYKTDEFKSWADRWQQRLASNGQPLSDSIALMKANNPAIIARNHQVEAALSAAEEHADLAPMHQLLAALASPYEDDPTFKDYQLPPVPSERVYQTFCGT